MTSASARPGSGGSVHKNWILLAVGGGSFMSAVDAGAVNTILPVLRRSFGSDVASIEWVVTIYLLVVGGLLLSCGRFADMRGHKDVYICGFGIFVLASAMCGLAPTAGALIAFRALQGIGAATLFANSTAILTTNFPASERGRALGLRATATYLGLTAGPFLGGWLTAELGWRAVFYINVPVGLVAVALTLRFVPRDRPPAHRTRFDLAGAAVWMASLAFLLLALNAGHGRGPASLTSLLLFLLAAMSLVLFLVIERRTPYRMLDLSLFRSRTFSASSAANIVHYLCVYMIVFLLPFYLIQGRGYGPARTGLILTAQSVARACAAPVSGALSDRIGSRLPAMVGMGVMALGLVLLSRLGEQSSLGYVAAALGITGLGAGVFISPNNSALMGSAPPGRQGLAGGVLATARVVGMALGVAVAGDILTSRIAGLHGNGSASAALVSAVSTSFLAAAGFACLGVLVAALEEPAGAAAPQAVRAAH